MLGSHLFRGNDGKFYGFIHNGNRRRQRKPFKILANLLKHEKNEAIEEFSEVILDSIADF